MARPTKERKVCGLPENRGFGPLNGCKKEDVILMSVDEYETIRLIDYEELTQADAAEQMHIARTTVQGIYSDARKKLAQAIVEGRKLQIAGGNYRICKGREDGCRRKGCRKKECRKGVVDENSNSSQE